MARKTRQRISYVLPLANHASGHRLGVNGLAVDADASLLYSGGRDGVICSWDLGLPLAQSISDDANDGIRRQRPSPVRTGSSKSATSVAAVAKTPTASAIRHQVQAHTHWINDITLVQSNEALVSASSDMTVKIWRPDTFDSSDSTGTGTGSSPSPAQSLGLHDDYVKCLASPGRGSKSTNGGNWDWVASGGLDHTIRIWDLHGAGQKLQIPVGEDDGTTTKKTAKGSVYALAATSSILASGGPESIVRVWDARSGKRIRNFVGHTDNIRHILVGRDGDVLVTASSDRTVKVWSMTAGRCMSTLTMHSDSVWSLYSDHPHLALFYSSDRSGLVAKTDARKCNDFDQGLCVAVFQEHEGVSKIVAADKYIWAGTSSSSINRWEDVDTSDAEIQLPDNYRAQRGSVTSIRSKHQSSVAAVPPPPPKNPLRPNVITQQRSQIPVHCLLIAANTSTHNIRPAKEVDASTLYTIATRRKASETFFDTDATHVVPYRAMPEYTIEGHNGLIKHVLLNDRRRVLTLDTSGEVTLWDLLKCVPIKSFGKRNIDDILPEVKTNENVAHWCNVDTRTGSLTCVLESNHCFDAEIYMDELQLEEKLEIKEDQRVNLGKWILRYLFASFIDEEIKRDQDYREQLLRNKFPRMQRENAPTAIVIPRSIPNGWHDTPANVSSPTTPKAGKHFQFPAMNSGLGIGVATPAPSVSNHSSQYSHTLSPTAENGDHQSTFLQSPSPAYSSGEKNDDYFALPGQGQQQATPGTVSEGRLSTDGTEEANPPPSSEPEKESQVKESGALFGKKLRMPFNMKKMSKAVLPENKISKSEEKTEESGSKSSQAEERVIEDNLFGVIQRIRYEYENQLQDGAQSLEPGITPSPPNETPTIKPPANTKVLIQEERPEHGGAADLFEGTIGTTGQYADLIEKIAPTWLGEVLLKNQMATKDVVKVYFLLEPYQNALPPISDAGDNRLNASGMLRSRKIMQYVSEKIEPKQEKPDLDALKPEEYLELYCQNQLVPPLMTLATVRSHLWRGGGDVVLYYRANGRKALPGSSDTPPPPPGIISSDASGSSKIS